MHVSDGSPTELVGRSMNFSRLKAPNTWNPCPELQSKNAWLIVGRPSIIQEAQCALEFSTEECLVDQGALCLAIEGASIDGRLTEALGLKQ